MDKHSCDYSKMTVSLDDDDYLMNFHGPAIERCYEDEKGKLFVDNHEYASQVNFCPYCGYKAKVKVVHKPYSH